MKKILIYLLSIFVVLGLFFARHNFGESTKVLNQDLKSATQESNSSLTPTPFQFQELTIPYLRSRGYKSELGELNKIAENNNYSSFLTSYESDGLKINGLLTQPKGTLPEDGWPAVVFVHGYIPPNQYRTTEKYTDYVNYLARKGFVVFKIDLRGHGDSEGEPSGAYYSSDYIIDTLNAYDALQKADFVNENKIGLWGHSMAGNIVLRSMAVKPDIPAAVIWSGTVYTYDDFQKFGIDDDSYQPPGRDSPRVKKRQELFDTFGRYSSESAFWSQVSPIDYLKDIQGAIQFHHAQNDTVVNIEYSRNINDLLKKAGVSSQLFEYSQGDHNLASPAFGTAMQRTVEFYKNHLRSSLVYF